jgi:hypothetical protein
MLTIYKGRITYLALFLGRDSIDSYNLNNILTIGFQINSGKKIENLILTTDLLFHYNLFFQIPKYVSNYFSGILIRYGLPPC